MADDVYDDVENIIANSDDTVNGATELPAGQVKDPSQSIYVPERGTDPNDGRGSIIVDGSEGEGSIDQPIQTTTNDDNGDDPDAERLSGDIPADERDGTQ